MPEQSQTIRRPQRLNSNVIKFTPIYVTHISVTRVSSRVRANTVRMCPDTFTNKSYYYTFSTFVIITIITKNFLNINIY